MILGRWHLSWNLKKKHIFFFFKKKCTWTYGLRSCRVLLFAQFLQKPVCLCRPENGRQIIDPGFVDGAGTTARTGNHKESSLHFTFFCSRTGEVTCKHLRLYMKSNSWKFNCSGSLEPEYSCHDRDWIMELPMEADILTFTGILTPEDASVASCFPFDITISLSWFPLLSMPP